MKDWKYISGANVGNSLVLRDGKYIIEQLEQSSTDKYAEKYFGMKKGNYCLKNTKTGVVLGWYTTLDAAKKSMEKWKDDDRVWGNSKTGNSIYSELKKGDKRVVIESDGSWYVYDKNDKIVEQGRESNSDNAFGKFKAKGYNKKACNQDGVARMFEGLVKDENKEVEKDSGTIEELEKVGNIQFAGDYYDIVQENPEEFYIYLNGGTRRYGPYRTKAAAEIELKKILDRRNRIGNTSTVSEYNAEIQRLTKKAEQLRRMGQGRQAMEVEKQIEKLGKELSEIGNKSSWNSDRSIYAKWDEQKGRPSDEYARITWMGQGKGGVANIWKGQSMTSEKFGSLDRKELERWAEQRIGNSEEYWKKQYIEAARKKGISEDKIQEFVKKLEKEGAKGVMTPIKNSSSDDKFAYVMREFEAGKLKSSSGDIVTDPEQAKAIAYSESKKAENGICRAFKAMNKKDPEGLRKKIEDYTGQGLSYADVVSNLIRFGYDKEDVEAQAEYIKKLTR